ncbi:Anthranilate O-methyltransferase 1 [Dichanthelium oligosanthes]|uniref:Anthranilate O-methyltransferase 1 n=1 Tax=Dichanthelium oligosanthes TaxID=888268 RepID=A0A1E5VS15_9POAL|nr:Anthranilate O-methyltransferase 1 [Dichanthelium oligosanthes]
MVVADLGCSSGPNTLILVTEVMSTICDLAQMDDHRGLELQFFLNDLPGNDFNLIFRSLKQLQLQNHAAMEKTAAPSYYIAGLPGSFYTRLFPCQSVHLFHSSYSLMWRSKVPKDLLSGTHLNEGNIYIGKTTPPVVVKLFQEQFRKDFELFLILRYRELVCGGRMVLTFLGRKSEDILMHGDVASMWELLSEALQTIIGKGRMDQEKLTSFNIPFYAPSMDEVKAMIKQTELFDIEHVGLFESNWDPQDDSSSDMVLNCASSGENVSKCIRAVIGPLIMDHFSEAILDELFLVYASIIGKHLEKGKAKYPVILVSLKRAVH